MRLSLVCAGIAIVVLAAACDKKEMATAPLLPVPVCKTAQAYDTAAFERMVRAMDRSGDYDAVVARFMEHRKTVEAQLAKRDPALLPRLKPVLDAQFSAARLRDRAACVFVELSGETGGVKILDAWSHSPEMRAINRAIWTRKPGPSKEPDFPMTLQRQALINDLAVAMALQHVEVNNAKVDRNGIPSLVAIFAPAPPPMPVAPPEPVPATDPATAPGTAPPPNVAPAQTVAAAPAATAVPAATAPAAPAPGAVPAPNGTPAPATAQPGAAVATTNPVPASVPAPVAAPAPVTVNTADLSVILNHWLVPALAKIPDEQIAKFLSFANTSFGGDYYVALSRAYDFQAGEWYSETAKKFSDNIPPAPAVAGGPGKDALVAAARYALRDVGTQPAAADAMAKLLEADRLDPRNPEIQTLLGEAAMKSAPAMPLAPDQLRVPIETPNYEKAEKYYLRAIELSPQYADAHMLLGRLRYLQGRDEEAAKAFESAIKIQPEHPSMDLYLGDLSYAKKEYSVAFRYYKAAISKPERLAYVHVNALSHLLMTLRKTTQVAEFPRIAESYLAKYPQAWNFRLDYADYLLDSNARADKVFAIADPIPDTWLPARKVPIISAGLIRKAGERVDPAGVPREESMQLMRRAIGMNPDPVTLAEAVCRAGVERSLALGVHETSKNAKALATELVICGLRWQRHDIVRGMAKRADVARLNLARPDLRGDTPLCYAAATRNLTGFSSLVEVQVSPVRKCADGNTVAERLLQMSFGKDPNVKQMQIMMKQYYKMS